MSDKKKRRKWSAADKWRIVMTGIQPGCEISNLCCQEGINVTQLYNLLGSANDILIRPREGLKSLNNAMKQNCNGSDWSSPRSRPKNWALGLKRTTTNCLRNCKSACIKMCILAWRVLWMCQLNRVSSELPASLVFTETAIKRLEYLQLMKETKESQTLGDFVIR